MSIWGIGRQLVVLSFVYAGFMTAISFMFPEIFMIKTVPYDVLVMLSVFMLCIGVPYLAVSGRKLTKCFKEKTLITDGVFSWSRNPIYSAWILFLIPALSLLSGSLLVLTTPVFSFFWFKGTIKKEEEYLEEKFGEEYFKYKSEVNELIPFPKAVLDSMPR